MGTKAAFFSSSLFLKHLLALIGTVLLILFVTYQWLDAFTNHGETISVPDLRGMKVSEIESFLAGKQLEVKISDSSVFIVDKQPGTVIDQDPAPNDKVKEGRTVYITVTRTVPPQIKFPDLIDVSHRQAEAILASYGLKVGQLVYKPDLAKDAVLGALLNGAELKPGAEVTKGVTVDLVLGDGIGSTDVIVPRLIGLTLDEAMFVLQGSNIKPGAVVYDVSVRDTNAARVYEQRPAPGDSVFVRQGEAIDLFLTQSSEKLK